MARLVISVADIRDGQSIVDVGCGAGGTLQLVDREFDDVRLLGIDPSASQIERARSVIGEAAAGNELELEVRSATDLGAEPSSVDRMLAVECIFHFGSRLRFLLAARRALVPGGHLVITDFVPVGPKLPVLSAHVLRRGATLADYMGKPSSPIPWTSSHYRAGARLAGLRVTADLDLTANTMPTYDELIAVFAASGHETAIRSTTVLKDLATKGLLRYRLLRFTKPASDSR